MSIARLRELSKEEILQVSGGAVGSAASPIDPLIRIEHALGQTLDSSTQLAFAIIDAIPTTLTTLYDVLHVSTILTSYDAPQ